MDECDLYTSSFSLACELNVNHKKFLNYVKTCINKWPFLDEELVNLDLEDDYGNMHNCYVFTRRSYEFIKDRSEGKFKLSSEAAEKVVLDTIEQLLNINIARQFNIGRFRLDGYCIETNTAYEVDERHHYDKNGILKKECQLRQAAIQNFLGCEFVRIKI